MDAINTPTYMRLRDQLRSDIVSGIWPLGSHVTLAELAVHYQVSAAPVREALLQLQGEGVIAMRMNRGAVIPTVDAKFIDNLYRVRGAIQTMLAREAAKNATKADVERMRQLAQAHIEASRSVDIAACVNANRELHRCIDRLANNPLAMEMLEGRSSLVDAFRRSTGYGQGRLDTVHKQHRKLIDAIASGDADKAAQISLEHTESSRMDLMQKALKT
jgi:DNA-binding GntR family transcriptional regulator